MEISRKADDNSMVAPFQPSSYVSHAADMGGVYKLMETIAATTTQHSTPAQSCMAVTLKVLEGLSAKLPPVLSSLQEEADSDEAAALLLTDCQEMKRVLESTVTDGLIQEYTNLGSVSASTAEASLLALINLVHWFGRLSMCRQMHQAFAPVVDRQQSLAAALVAVVLGLQDKVTKLEAQLASSGNAASTMASPMQDMCRGSSACNSSAAGLQQSEPHQSLLDHTRAKQDLGLTKKAGHTKSRQHSKCLGMAGSRGTEAASVARAADTAGAATGGATTTPSAADSMLEGGSSFSTWSISTAPVTPGGTVMVAGDVADGWSTGLSLSLITDNLAHCWGSGSSSGSTTPRRHLSSTGGIIEGGCRVNGSQHRSNDMLKRGSGARSGPHSKPRSGSRHSKAGQQQWRPVKKAASTQGDRADGPWRQEQSRTLSKATNKPGAAAADVWGGDASALHDGWPASSSYSTADAAGGTYDGW